jgi:hypothetical protein
MKADRAPLDVGSASDCSYMVAKIKGWKSHERRRKS